MSSTDLVRQETRSPAAVTSSFLDRIAAATELLEDASASKEIREVRDIAMAAEAYAQALDSREAYKAAAELRLRAERKAGSVRAQLPRRMGTKAKANAKRVLTSEQIEEARLLKQDGQFNYQIAERFGVNRSTIQRLSKQGWKYKEHTSEKPELVEFDEQFGVSYATANAWQRLSAIPDKDWEVVLAEALAKDRAMGCGAIAAHYFREQLVRVAPNIYRAPDEVLVLRWQRSGVAYGRRLNHSDLPRAQRELAVSRGDLKIPAGRARSSVADAYSHVRLALQALERSGKHREQAKEAVALATAALHQAEDQLVKASALI